RLFGSSPRVGLSWQQRQLHQAVTHELTRAPGKAGAGRPDRAAILTGGRAPDEGTVSGVAACPYLEEGGRYVGFNGHGRRHKRHVRGRGYSPLAWARRAGYELPGEGGPPWRQVRGFLRDLGRLAGPFGLVAAAWHPVECAWRPLDELGAMTRTAAGRAW